MTEESDSTFSQSPQHQAVCFSVISKYALGNCLDFHIGVHHCHPTDPPGSPTAPRHAPGTSLQLNENQEPRLPNFTVKSHPTSITYCLKKLFQNSLSFLVRKEKSSFTPAQRIAFIRASIDLQWQVFNLLQKIFMRLSHAFSKGRQAKSSARVLLGSHGADGNIHPNYHIYHIENETLLGLAMLSLRERNSLEAFVIISQ